jgi:prepilin-type N-terminal cleavage/methylation domain-containing protein
MRLQPPARYSANRPGFTLAELVTVVVIIGVLASIAIPKFAEAKTKAMAATAQSDLRNLVVAQDNFHGDNRTYSSDLNALDVAPSRNVVVTVLEHSTTGWSATATYQNGQCAIYYGSASPLHPATVSAVATCD